MTQAIQLTQVPNILSPSAAEWALLKEQATIVIKSKFLPPAVDTAEKAIAVAMKGRELGIPLMQAFSHINIIQGKPTISAELMLSLIYRNCAGAVINYLVNTPEKCTIQASRPRHKEMEFTYTIEEAKTAGLLSKDSWKKYPAAMLRARAVSIAARALFPDAIMGCSYVPEELGADVNEDGKVITIPAEPNPHAAKNNQPEEGDGIQAPLPACDCKTELKFSKTKKNPNGVWFCPDWENKEKTHIFPVTPAEYNKWKNEIVQHHLDRKRAEESVEE